MQEQLLYRPLNWQIGLVASTLVAIALYFLIGQVLPLYVIIFIGGVPLAIRIIIKAFGGNLGSDVLGVIALITAAILAQYLAATLIILMLSGGEALEAYAVRRASSVLRVLASRMPEKAHRRIHNRIEDIALHDIAIGDHIVVYPHEITPVDGIVIEGHGSMNEAYLTGEPYFVPKAPGVSVISGAVNGESALIITADKRPQDSRYAKIMEVMEDAEQKRPKLRRIGDQIGGFFSIFALAMAGIAWLITGDPLRFLSVLVIATPCPLIIAIPVTIISAISMSARRGIVIKDPLVLERLPTCRTAIFDKTGTLTYGTPELVEMVTDPEFTRDALLSITASIEKYSKHPLASAVLKAANESKLVMREAQSVSEKPGQGLTGTVDGQHITITHRKKLSGVFLDKLPPPQPGMECIVLVNGKLGATLRFRDAPRAEGRSFITHLGPRHQFEKVMLVSGDCESEVDYLAGLMGIQETYANQSPEQKVAIVEREVAKAPTVFIGDGINDAPGLAVATVGIAFGHQSVTAEAAGAVIMDNTLVKVDELLHISTALRRIALQSAIGGMLLSIIGMMVAAFGYITPIQGALLQELIDVLAILNALRLTWQPDIKADMG